MSMLKVLYVFKSVMLCFHETFAFSIHHLNEQKVVHPLYFSKTLGQKRFRYIFELTIFSKLAVNVLICYYLCLVSDGATTTGAPSGIPPPQVLLGLPQFPGHREAGADPPLSPLWFLPPPVDPYIPVYVDKHWIQRARNGHMISLNQWQPIDFN